MNQEIKSGVKNTQRNERRHLPSSEMKKIIENMRAKDAELITGTFRNLENRASSTISGVVAFPFKAYKGDEVVVYELKDGERYKLPRGVVRHLNNNCFYKEYTPVPSGIGIQGTLHGGILGDGMMSRKNMQASRKVHRFLFDTTEIDREDHEMQRSNLIEVTEGP